MITFSFRRRVGASLAVLAGLGVAACSSSSGTPSTQLAQTVTVIGLNTDASHILSSIYADALNKGGFRVGRRDDAANIGDGIAALQSGAADLFVVGSNDLLTYLAQTLPAASSTSTTTTTTTTTIAASTTIEATTTTEAPTTTSKATTSDTTAGSGSTSGTDAGTSTTVEETTTTVSTAGQAAALSINGQTNEIGEILPPDLQIGGPSSAENKSVIACVSTVLTGISNLTDLARAASGLRIAGTADFEKGSPFGLVGFKKTFGASFEKFVKVDAGKVAAAMTPATPAGASTTTSTTTAASTPVTLPDDPTKRDADCGAFNSLDPTITSSMTVLDDDKDWVTTNGYIPLVTKTGFTPGVSQMLDKVSQALSTPTLREMVREVVVDSTPAAVVADDWLQTVGITS